MRCENKIKEAAMQPLLFYVLQYYSCPVTMS